MLVFERRGMKVIPVRAIPIVTSGFLRAGHVLQMLRSGAGNVLERDLMPTAYRCNPSGEDTRILPNHVDLLTRGLPQPTKQSAVGLYYDQEIGMLPPAAYVHHEPLKEFFYDAVGDELARTGHPDLEPNGRIRWDEAPPLQADVLALVVEGFEIATSIISGVASSAKVQPVIRTRPHRHADIIALLPPGIEIIDGWFREREHGEAFELNPWSISRTRLCELLKRAISFPRKISDGVLIDLLNELGYEGARGRRRNDNTQEDIAKAILGERP